jgi:hypothetical protein
MAERKAVSKRTRFEVFKRDSFTCQYCGGAAPDVILQVDHIVPVAAGGSSGLTNLVTACVDCNSGKSSKTLEDGAAVKIAKRQLDVLNERREQIEMMAKWKIGLETGDDLAVRKAAEYWESKTPGFHLLPSGLLAVRKLIRRFGLAAVLEAIPTAADGYLRYADVKPTPTKESVDLAFEKIGGVCFCTAKTKSDPDLPQLYAIRAALRRRCGYFVDWQAMKWLVAARDAGNSVDTLRSTCAGCRTWTDFRRAIEDTGIST